MFACRAKVWPRVSSPREIAIAVARAMLLPSLVALVQAAFVVPPPTTLHAARRVPTALRCAGGQEVGPAGVPLVHMNPSPALEPREVISSVMAALHRSNWDQPTPFYGFEVALRFLAPTHDAKIRKAKPGGFYRWLRQPHKLCMITWGEYRFEGDPIILMGPAEAGEKETYQMTSLRSSPNADWVNARWKLVKECRAGPHMVHCHRPCTFPSVRR